MTYAPPTPAKRLPWRFIACLLVVTAVLPFLIAALRKDGPRAPSTAELLLCSATRQDFVYVVEAKGAVESAVNAEVCCEVKSRADGWIRILEVVEEGTRVKKGDFLVRLDSSALEDDRLAQKILCERAEANYILASNNARAARVNRTEYLEGEYKITHEQCQRDALLAEEKVQRSKEYLDYSKRMRGRDYTTDEQVQADAFEVTSAENALHLAKTKLHVLEEYTRVRRLRELDSQIVVCQARLVAADRIRRLYADRLADIDDQIKKCIVRAPTAGQVVLAHLYHEDHAHMIEPGELSREHRALVRLPDPQQMQVKVLVPEENIRTVRPGVPVDIELGAYPNRRLHGVVTRVNQYPEPEQWMGAAIKQYQAIVRIDTKFDGLRPGLTADVAFGVQRLDDRLQVPCQAVFRKDAKDYCICVDGDRWEARQVVTGPSNGKYVVIERGIEEGRQVVLGAAAFRDKVPLPATPTPSPAVAGGQRDKATDSQG